MIQLNDLSKELNEVKDELHIVHGGGFSPLNTALGGCLNLQAFFYKEH